MLQLVSAFAYSGPAAATVSLCTELAKLGHDVVIGHDTVRPDGNEHEEGMGPAVAAAGIPVATELSLCTRNGPLAILRDRRLLRVRMAGVDVVHAHFTHDHVLAASARRGRRPVLVRTVHSERSLRDRPGQGWLLRQADAVVVHAAERIDAGVALGVPRGSFHVIRGPVDIARFHVEERASRRAAFRGRHGIPVGAPVLLMAAIFQAGRGHDLVLRAWPRVKAAVPDAELCFAGLGELRPALMEQARGVEGVRFLGYLKDDLPDAYAAADATVLVALGNDGYGRAALESLASGTPVVVPERVPELADVARASGAVFSQDDGLADEVIRVLRGRADVVAVARDHAVREHAADVIARRTLDLYARLLAQGD